VAHLRLRSFMRNKKELSSQNERLPVDLKRPRRSRSCLRKEAPCVCLFICSQISVVERIESVERSCKVFKCVCVRGVIYMFVAFVQYTVFALYNLVKARLMVNLLPDCFFCFIQAIMRQTLLLNVRSVINWLRSCIHFYECIQSGPTQPPWRGRRSVTPTLTQSRHSRLIL
jgi:hypothetical protein